MNKQFNDVKLVYTHTLRTPSQYGAYQYSFIVNRTVFFDACRKAIEANKRISWKANEISDTKLLKLTHAKTPMEIENVDIVSHMKEGDILVSVKGFKGMGKDKVPSMIRTTNPNKYPGWFSTANVIIDIYVWEWAGKKGISCQANGDLITIQVTDYVESDTDNCAKGFNPEVEESVSQVFELEEDDTLL